MQPGGREAPVGGRAPPGLMRPLTRPTHHCLRVVGSGVGLDRSSVGTLPRCFDLMGFYIFSFAQISVGKHLLCILPCIYVLQNNILQIHVELGQ
jgi:hypothetical protein